MIVRRLWGIAIVAGLLVLVAAGFWSYLFSSVDPATSSTSAVVALGAAVVVVVGILARGEGKAAVAKVRQVIGAIGLFLTPVLGALTLFALADPPMVPVFLLLTVLALLAWMQGIAAQSGLSFRVLFQWFAVLAVFAVVVVAVGGVLAGVLAAVLIRVLRVDSEDGTRLALIAVFTLIAGLLIGWSKGRRDRQAVRRAVGRAAFGRARIGDIAILGAGPGPVLRGRSKEGDLAERDAQRADWDARLAASDARLADPAPGDRDAPAGDR